MRVLVSLEGPTPGSTRRALAEIPHDAVHVLAVDPTSDELSRTRRLVERTGASFTIETLQEGDLLETFEAIVDTLEALAADGDDVAVQVNAGKDANVLSAAGLLACLHLGIPAHFVHEVGHTPLPVLTRAPLDQLLSADERASLLGFPEAGIRLDEAGQHDPGALNGLKDRGLIVREEDRLVLTEQGEAYKTHLGRRRRVLESG